MIASPVLNETEKIRPQARLKLAQKIVSEPKRSTSLIPWPPEHKVHYIS